MSNLSQRDAFWNRVYEIAKTDRRIVIVSADMGAPALDQIRRDLPGQFINAGIAEQNAMLVAAGLALEGKRPFFYAIAPFAVFRPIEQIRVQHSIMNIPVTIVGVGAGFSYEDSGPTHHILEDIAMIRSLPHITIHSVSDASLAAAVAEQSCSWPTANYVRLDRQVLPDLHKTTPDFEKGFAVLQEGTAGFILATGYMVHKAVDVAHRLESDGASVGVIDIFQLPFDAAALVKAIGAVSHLFTLEEHFLPGGLGSAVLEALNDQGVTKSVKRFGLPSEYSYVYGGRERIHAAYGLDPNNLQKNMLSVLTRR